MLPMPEKRIFPMKKPVALWIPGWSLVGWLGLNQRTWYFAGILSVGVFLSIQQRMGGVGDLGGEPSAALVEGRLRESFELSMWNCPNLFINIYRNVLFVNFYQKTKCFKSATRDFGGDKIVTGHCKNVFCVRYCISSISLEMCQKIAH